MSVSVSCGNKIEFSFGTNYESFCSDNHINYMNYIPYSAKRWRGKTLANLVNPEQFAKVLPIQIFVAIL